MALLRYFATASCTLIFAHAYVGGATGTLPLIAEAARRAIAYTVLATALLVLTLLGLIVFIIPGLSLLQRYALAPTVLLLEDLSIPSALQRSQSLCHSERRRVLQAYIVVYGLYWISALLLRKYAPAWLGTFHLRHWLSLTLTTLALPGAAAFNTALYYDLRTRAEPAVAAFGAPPYVSVAV